jgi:DNA-binding transcriptional ArsR family regulator
MYLVMVSAPPGDDVFVAIADQTRRALLRRLAEQGERNVTELLEPFSISQPAVSKHLRCLRKAGLVRRRKVGRMRLYAIDAAKLRQVHDWVTYFEKYWDEKLDALGRYLDKEKQRKKTGLPGGL